MADWPLSYFPIENGSPLPSSRTWRYWGRRGGSMHKDGTLAFRIKRMGPASSNSHSKARHDNGLLADNARARGYLNGVKL